METIITNLISITEIPTPVIALLAGISMLLLQVLKNLAPKVSKYAISFAWMFAIILAYLIVPFEHSLKLYILEILATAFVISTSASGVYEQGKKLLVKKEDSPESEYEV